MLPPGVPSFPLPEGTPVVLGNPPAPEVSKLPALILPPEVTLTSFSFSKGVRLSLRGNASADDQSKIAEYNEAMSKATLNGATLFTQVNPYNIAVNGNTAAWGFECTLQPGQNE